MVDVGKIYQSHGSYGYWSPVALCFPWSLQFGLPEPQRTVGPEPILIQLELWVINGRYEWTKKNGFHCFFFITTYKWSYFGPLLLTGVVGAHLVKPKPRFAEVLSSHTCRQLAGRGGREGCVWWWFVVFFLVVFVKSTRVSIPDAQWGWPIYLQNWVVLGVNVSKYTSPIEHLGMEVSRLGFPNLKI